MTISQLAVIQQQLETAATALQGVVTAMEKKGLGVIECTSTTEIVRSLRGIPGFVAGAQSGLADAVGTLRQQRVEQAEADPDKPMD